MRIGGLASGMDIDSIINDMMKANRIPLDKVTQKKSYLEYQMNDYRAANRQLNDFSTMSWDSMLNPLTSVFRKKTVENSAPNDVSIKSLNSTGDFSGTLKIKELATNATLQGSIIAKGVGRSADTVTLADLDIIGDTTITIGAINKIGNYEEGEPLKFSSTNTIQDVLNKINAQPGVNAFYDAKKGQIVMSAKNSGSGVDDVAIKVEGELATSLGFTTGNTSSNNGSDAEFTLNGLDMERSSNTFEVNGFEFTLKATNTTGINFKSAVDTGEIFDTIVKFVNEYNKMIEDLHTKISEPKYRSYQPLSDEQKADMKETEIKLWEEKAMSGTLRNDPTLSSMLSQMRTALMGTVGEGGFSLKDIGISSSRNYLENGKLVIDEAALKKAISENPTKVEEMFRKTGVTQADKGFALRLRTIVDTSQKDITNKAGKVGFTNETFSLGRALKDMNKQIERFEDRLKMTETRLWKQFTAMEQAIQRANAQSAQLMGSFGGA